MRQHAASPSTAGGCSAEPRACSPDPRSAAPGRCPRCCRPGPARARSSSRARSCARARSHSQPRSRPRGGSPRPPVRRGRFFPAPRPVGAGRRAPGTAWGCAAFSLEGVTEQPAAPLALIVPCCAVWRQDSVSVLGVCGCLLNEGHLPTGAVPLFSSGRIQACQETKPARPLALVRCALGLIKLLETLKLGVDFIFA